MPTNYTAKAGETLCEVGINNGFADCAKLRAAKKEQADIVTLKDKQDVLIPDRDKNMFDRALEQLHVFTRPRFPPPKVTIIRDEGNAAKLPPKPEDDPKISVLAFTNYVEDRGTDGTVKGNFPGPEQQLYDPKGSKDPDHFKIQVYDSDAASDTVTVELVPMRPDYYALVQAGATYVALHPTKRKPHDEHKMTVTCKRIPGTFYFRSPYMRLAPTKAGAKKLEKQNLLISGFWNDGGGEYLRRYGEQLHHTVRATYKLAACPAKKCAAVVVASIEASRSIHMAFWILKSTNSSDAKIRETIATWTRAALAPTNVRPIVESIKSVPKPTNMIAVANDGSVPSTTGFHASGKMGPATPSRMAMTIDNVDLFYNPGTGDSPATTAAGLVALIAAEPKLRGYTTKLFTLPPRNPAASTAAQPISASVDILVFKPDGSMADVSAATSSDFPNAAGNMGQSIMVPTVAPNFPIAWPDATPEERIVRHNFERAKCINLYVVGSVLTDFSSGKTYDGWSPLGNFLGSYADIGPCVFLDEPGVTSPFIIFHEICHPMLHGFHADAPLKDASIGAAAGAAVATSELMNPFLDSSDSHDATRHLADKPIAAKYQLAEEGGTSTLVDGTNIGPTSKIAWTPTQRLYIVGVNYGIVRYGVLPLLDSDIHDLPHGP